MFASFFTILFLNNYFEYLTLFRNKQKSYWLEFVYVESVNMLIDAVNLCQCVWVWEKPLWDIWPSFNNNITLITLFDVIIDLICEWIRHLMPLYTVYECDAVIVTSSPWKPSTNLKRKSIFTGNTFSIRQFYPTIQIKHKL